MNTNDIENKWSDEHGLITYEDWEKRVFLAATRYSVVVPLGSGRVTTKWYATYPEAMIIALHTPRSILYVSTESGRAVCIPRKAYPTYLEVYNKATGQRLRMPPDPLNVTAKREPDRKGHQRVRVRITSKPS